MADPAKFRHDIKKIISPGYEIEFLGEEFDELVNMLPDAKAGNICGWVAKVKDKAIRPITVSKGKKYKQWVAKELLVFRYPFSIGNAEYRILLVKVKNSIYIEFHMVNHKYYDQVRDDLYLKKNSY